MATNKEIAAAMTVKLEDLFATLPPQIEFQPGLRRAPARARLCGLGHKTAQSGRRRRPRPGLYKTSDCIYLHNCMDNQRGTPWSD